MHRIAGWPATHAFPLPSSAPEPSGMLWSPRSRGGVLEAVGQGPSSRIIMSQGHESRATRGLHAIRSWLDQVDFHCCDSLGSVIRFRILEGSPGATACSIIHIRVGATANPERSGR